MLPADLARGAGRGAPAVDERSARTARRRPAPSGHRPFPSLGCRDRAAWALESIRFASRCKRPVRRSKPIATVWRQTRYGQRCPCTPVPARRPDETGGLTPCLACRHQHSLPKQTSSPKRKPHGSRNCRPQGHRLRVEPRARQGLRARAGRSRLRGRDQRPRRQDAGRHRRRARPASPAPRSSRSPPTSPRRRARRRCSPPARSPTS